MLPYAVTLIFLLPSISLSTPALSSPPAEQILSQRPQTQKPELRKLRRNTRLWNVQNLVNYRYTLTRSCFCVSEARGPVVIEVRAGNTVSVTSVATGQPVDSQLFNQYDTVPKLFNVIRDATARNAASLVTDYDAKTGYPKSINIDYDYQQADEELRLTVEDFQVLR